LTLRTVHAAGQAGWDAGLLSGGGDLCVSRDLGLGHAAFDRVSLGQREGNHADSEQ